MLDILKSLAPEQVGFVLIVLGLVREARIIYLAKLQNKLEMKKLDSQKDKGCGD